MAALLFLAAAMPLSARGFIVKGGYSATKLQIALDIDPAPGSPATGFRAQGNPLWHAGIGFQSSGFNGFSLQPEILYKVRGVTLDNTSSVNTSLIEVPLNIQWGIDLLVAKPYLFASPFVSWGINHFTGKRSGTPSGSVDAFMKNIAEFDYGFGLGFGLDVALFQLTVKYNWYFGKAYDWSHYCHAVTHLDRNAPTLDISLGLKF